MNQGYSSGYCTANYQNNMDTFDNFMISKENNQPNLSNDVDLYLSLKEIGTGCTKTLYFKRLQRLKNMTIRRDVQKLTVIVPPGCPIGYKFVFPRQGDCMVQSEPSDVVVTIRNKRNPYFKREGSDLIHHATIARYHLERGTKIKVPTLHGNFIWVAVKRKKVKKIQGYGLPIFNHPEHLRGDLVIKLNVEEPKRVTRLSLCCP